MNDFLFVLNQLLIDFIKKSPIKDFAKAALWTYTTFKHFNNPVILRFNNLKDLYNTLSKNGILNHRYKYKGRSSYVLQLMGYNNTNSMVRGVWDITNFFKQSWPPVIRDQIYDELRLYLRLGGVIIYQGELLTTREQLYKTNQRIKRPYYTKNGYSMRKTTNIRFKI